MTYQEATTEQLLAMLTRARESLFMSQFAERDYLKEAGSANMQIQNCSQELKARGVPHDTHQKAPAAFGGEAA